MHRSTTKDNNENDKHAVNIRVQPSVHGNGSSRMAASFKEVVESFAHQHDISFHPKSNSMKDGKPIFMFGEHPVYLDKNVLYAKRGDSWQPISLEHLAQSC